MNNLVEQYLVFAEGQAMRRIPMSMSDWVNKLDGFLTLNDRDILTHAGKVSHEMAKQLAEQEYEKFHYVQLHNEATEADQQLAQLAQATAQRVKPKKPSGED